MKDKIISLGISSREAEELISVSKNIEEDYQKLLEGYPIQYLIGYVDFYGYKINVNQSVLIPRYETEYLVEKTIKYAKEMFNNKINILDIGTGSGCIAIALKKELNSEVSASDIKEEALEVARENARINNANINFIKSDMLDNITGQYDIIISNPPYISYSEEIMDSVKKYEPHSALYAKDNGLFFYKKILDNVKKHLNHKYLIAFEIGYTQSHSIVNMIIDNFDIVTVSIEKDLSGKDRYIFIKSE